MNSLYTLIYVLALVAIANAVVVTHPLRRHKASMVRQAPAKLRADRLKKASSPLSDRNLEDNYYVIDIQVGTPAQDFTVAIGTNYSTLVLQSKKCVGCAWPQPGDNYTAHLFDQTKSSTFKTGPRFNNQWAQDAGTMGFDTVKISNIAVTGQEFALSESFDYKDLDYRPVDGILGLSWPSGAVDGATPFIQSAAKQLDAPVFTIYLGAYAAYEQDKVDGQITFGGLDTQNCGGSPWTYVPVTVGYAWIVELHGFQIGKYVSKEKHQALFDTQQSTLLVPGWEFDRIVSATGAEYDSEILNYVVDCKKIATLPKISVALGSTKGSYFEIAATQYIIKNYGGYGKCVLDIEAQENGGWEPNWVFGGAFLRSYCQAYDFGHQRIGLSLPKVSN